MKAHKISYSTKKLDVQIHYSSETIRTEKVKTDPEGFEELCKECKSYNNNWSCPPVSPSWSDLEHLNYLGVIVLYIHYKDIQIKNKFLVSQNINRILAPMLRKVCLRLEGKIGNRSYKSGQCRLCRTCGKQVNESCRHPKKMRYSLESLGVNVSHLSKLAGHKIEWYGSNKDPKYGSVVGAIELKKNKDLNPILREIMSDITEKKKNS